MNKAFISLCMAISPVYCQFDVEVPSGATVEPVLDAEWSAGPPHTSRPVWAQPGSIRFARWDGGSIETAKAFLSGWPGFNPPIPSYVHVMTNWYDLRTVRFLRQADINLVWV